MYIEPIKEEAEWAHNYAKLKWITCIQEGIDYILSNDSSQELIKFMVKQDTQMRRKTFETICSQGSVTREKWLFPWED